jgi:site-specific DNA-methyltransferase (adenine-specific)
MNLNGGNRVKMLKFIYHPTYLMNMELNKIELMDCNDYLRKVPDKFVNLIVIDPPYNELPKDWDNFKGWDNINKEFHRVLKDNGQIYIFGKQPMLSEVLSILKKQFEFRFELIWNKGKGFWASNHMPMRSHELIWCLKKKGIKTSQLHFDIESIKTPGKPYVRKNKVISTVRNGWKPNHTIYKDGRRFPLSVLNHPSVSSKSQEGTKHPTQKPIEILKWIIKSSSKENDIILDCFMGSGSTAVAAKMLSRNYIGCEIEKDFYNISVNRINTIKENY